jgi:hypothetical protein
MTKNMIANNGVRSLYSGMTASLLRQGTYSTVRFAFYEIAKKIVMEKTGQGDISFYKKVVLAGLGGGLGSLFGSPCDLVTVCIPI